MSCSLHSHLGGVTIPPDTLHLTLMSSVLLLTSSSSVSLTQDVEDLADPGSFETISQPGNSIAELFEPIPDWKDWKREILNCSVNLPISQDVSLFGCPDCGDQDQDDVLRCSVHQWLAFSVLILSISKILSIVLPTFVLMAISNVLAHNTEDNSSFTHFPKNFVVHWKCFWLLSINYFSIYMEIAQSIIRFKLLLFNTGLIGPQWHIE